MEAFIAAYRTVGHAPADDSWLAAGLEKIALYTDIVHKTPHDLEDDSYGRVAVILQRPRSSRR